MRCGTSLAFGGVERCDPEGRGPEVTGSTHCFPDALVGVLSLGSDIDSTFFDLVGVQGFLTAADGTTFFTVVRLPLLMIS